MVEGVWEQGARQSDVRGATAPRGLWGTQKEPQGRGEGAGVRCQGRVQPPARSLQAEQGAQTLGGRAGSG